MSRLINKYFDNMRMDGRSELTIRNYGVDLKQFANFISSKGLNLDADIKSIDFPILNEYKLSLAKLSPNSINRKLNSLKSFFCFLECNKIVNVDYSKQLKCVKVVKKEAVALTKEETLNVINTAKDNIVSVAFGNERCVEFKRYRDLAIIAILTATGLRSSEFRSLKLQDVDLKSGMISVFGKGGKYRKVFLNEELLKIYERYLKVRKMQLKKCNVETDIAFISYRGKEISCKDLNKIVKKHVINAGIDLEKASKFHTHNTRHTCATNLIENDVNVATVSKILGHKNINTTISIYTHMHDKNIKNAMSNLY